MTEAEAEALLGDYTGIWVLDESGSSPQMSAPQPPRDQSVTVSSQDRERVLRELEAEQRAAVRSAQYPRGAAPSPRHA